MGIPPISFLYPQGLEHFLTHRSAQEIFVKLISAHGSHCQNQILTNMLLLLPTSYISLLLFFSGVLKNQAVFQCISAFFFSLQMTELIRYKYKQRLVAVKPMVRKQISQPWTSLTLAKAVRTLSNIFCLDEWVIQFVAALKRVSDYPRPQIKTIIQQACNENKYRQELFKGIYFKLP